MKLRFLFPLIFWTIIIVIAVFIVYVTNQDASEKRQEESPQKQNEQVIFDQYKEQYPLLKNVVLPYNFAITPLKGELRDIRYQDLASNYLFETLDIVDTGKKSDIVGNIQDYQYSLYKISPDGTIIDKFTLPEPLTFYSAYYSDEHNQSYLPQPYLVGEGIYSNWLTTGDATIHHVPLSPSILNDVQYNKLHDEAVAVFIFGMNYDEDALLREQGLRGYTVMMLNSQGQWNYYKLHSVNSHSDMENKQPKAFSFLKNDRVGKIDDFDFFDERPSKIPMEMHFDYYYPKPLNVNLKIDYFYVTRYATPKKMFQIYYSDSDRDEGTAFLTLTYKGQDFKFRTKTIPCSSASNCLVPLSIVGNDRFIIVDNKYIIKPHNAM